jgi:hypothetical protein
MSAFPYVASCGSVKIRFGAVFSMIIKRQPQVEESHNRIEYHRRILE